MGQMILLEHQAGALVLADVGQGWPVIETFEWVATVDSYTPDSN